MDIKNHQDFADKLNQCTILYVEDDLNVNKYISEFLKRYFKEVYSVFNGEEALEYYKKHSPNIMLVDIDLPKMNGIDLIKLIRKNDKKTKILISTAYTSKEFTIEAIELFITRYLVKPIVGKELLTALVKCIDEMNELAFEEKSVDLGKGYSYNVHKKSLFHDKKEIILRKKESQLLDFFVQHQNQIVSYELLESNVWNNEYMSEDAIRSQVRNLRKSTHSNILKNISGVGYKLYNVEEQNE